jgi:phage-related protein
LSSAANSLASSAANQLYGAGVNAAQGLVNGLKSQQALITKQMDVIAASMVKAIKKALGIHSPSRVMRDQVGSQIVAGLVSGITRDAGSA